MPSTIKIGNVTYNVSYNQNDKSGKSSAIYYGDLVARHERDSGGRHRSAAGDRVPVVARGQGRAGSGARAVRKIRVLSLKSTAFGILSIASLIISFNTADADTLSYKLWVSHLPPEPVKYNPVLCDRPDSKFLQDKLAYETSISSAYDRMGEDHNDIDKGFVLLNKYGSIDTKCVTMLINMHKWPQIDLDPKVQFTQAINNFSEHGCLGYHRLISMLRAAGEGGPGSGEDGVPEADYSAAVITLKCGGGVNAASNFLFLAKEKGYFPAYTLSSQIQSFFGGGL